MADLIKDRVVHGPAHVRKASGAGQGRRFAPRDYRDLLEVIILKASGTKRRSAWIAQLWFRGHDYPLERVRAAFKAEVNVKRKAILENPAPTGRWTEPFGVKYDRRVRRRSDRPDDQTPEFVEIGEVLSAMMVRPSALSDIDPDVGIIARSLVADTPLASEEVALEAALHQVLDAIRTGAPSIPDSAALTLSRLVSATPIGPFVQSLFADPDAAKSMEQLSNNVVGLIDDGHGHSKLIDAIDAAAADDFEVTRRWYRGLRSGRIARALEDAVSTASDGDEEMLGTFAAWARGQQRMIRSNPDYAAYLFACQLLSKTPMGRTISPSGTIDVNALLRALRERE